MQLSWKSSKSESLSFCTSSLSAFRASKNCSQMVARPVDVRASFKRLRPWQQPKAPKRWNDGKKSGHQTLVSILLKRLAETLQFHGTKVAHLNMKDEGHIIKRTVVWRVGVSYFRRLLYAQQSLSPSFHRFLKPLQRMFFWRKKMYSLPPPSATPPTHLLWKTFGVFKSKIQRTTNKLNSK